MDMMVFIFRCVRILCYEDAEDSAEDDPELFQCLSSLSHYLISQLFTEETEAKAPTTAVRAVDRDTAVTAVASLLICLAKQDVDAPFSKIDVGQLDQLHALVLRSDYDEEDEVVEQKEPSPEAGLQVEDGARIYRQSVWGLWHAIAASSFGLTWPTIKNVVEKARQETEASAKQAVEAARQAASQKKEEVEVEEVLADSSARIVASIVSETVCEKKGWTPQVVVDKACNRQESETRKERIKRRRDKVRVFGRFYCCFRRLNLAVFRPISLWNLRLLLLVVVVRS